MQLQQRPLRLDPRRQMRVDVLREELRGVLLRLRDLERPPATTRRSGAVRDEALGLAKRGHQRRQQLIVFFLRLSRHVRGNQYGHDLTSSCLLSESTIPPWT